ncbi:MAG: flagellar basal body P-ring protein FlgI, partial [bacterium]
ILKEDAMKRNLTDAMALVALTAAVLLAASSAAEGAVRLKDIARIRGVRENQLVGYGLVVGLNGTGDGVDMTYQAIVNMLDRMGIVVDLGAVNVDNVAAVMVTANLPGFVKTGDRIDVVVSSIGDADSLQGGNLLMTPLKAANGEVYAVAQGPVSIGGFMARAGGGAQAQKAFPTTGRIPGGAIVEREVPSEFVDRNRIYVNLNNPDFTTAARVAEALDKKFGAGASMAQDPSTIRVTVPEPYSDNVVSFIAEVEAVKIVQDEVARVVINERTGTIVMGGDVSISPVAIAHGSLTVTVEPGYEMLEPAPFTPGEPGAVPAPKLTAEEEKVTFTRVTTEDVVKALNAMGVTPSDIIAIFQALKASGALQAELVIM